MAAENEQPIHVCAPTAAPSTVCLYGAGGCAVEQTSRLPTQTAVGSRSVPGELPVLRARVSSKLVSQTHKYLNKLACLLARVSDSFVGRREVHIWVSPHSLILAVSQLTACMCLQSAARFGGERFGVRCSVLVC